MSSKPSSGLSDPLRGGLRDKVAALVIGGWPPGGEEHIRAAQAQLGPDAIEAVKLLLWGAEVVAREARISPDDE
jgi:hypothetical protein